MREIGTVPDARAAQRLSDYLLTLDIRSRIDVHPPGAAEAPGATVWILEEDQRERAREELTRFLAHPDDPRYEQAAAQARELARQAEAQEKQYRKNVVDVRSRWDARSVARRPVTMALIGISLFVALISRFGDELVTNSWTQELFITPIQVQGDMLVFPRTLQPTLDGEWWRLVTPIFLHFGLIHLLFNVFALVDLGTQVESRRGSWRMLLLVLLIAVPSNMAQFYYQGNPQFGGLSGVAFGLFGYIWMKSQFAPTSGFYLHPNVVVMMMAWFALCFTGMVGNVANVVHSVGLGVGILVGLAPVAWNGLRRS